MLAVTKRMNDFLQEPKPQWSVEKLRTIAGFDALVETVITNAKAREELINSE